MLIDIDLYSFLISHSF